MIEICAIRVDVGIQSMDDAHPDGKYWYKERLNKYSMLVTERMRAQRPSTLRRPGIDKYVCMDSTCQNDVIGE